jgi:hypothetical protein
MRLRSSLVSAGVLVAAGFGRVGAQTPSADSLLARACGGGGGVAYGLLVVEFRPDVDQARRAAIVKQSGALFVGVAADNPDVGYVAVPSGSRPDAAADRLIRLDGVQTVGEVACPAAAPPPAAAAGDTTGRPDTTARPPAPADTGRAPAAPRDTTRPPAPGDTTRGAVPADTTRSASPADTTAGPATGPT